VLLVSRAVFNITIDGAAAPPTVLACNASDRYLLASGLDTAAQHNVTLTLRTEAKVCNRTLFLSAFPMFVPSVSW
jgi:hypothetical protein